MKGETKKYIIGYPVDADVERENLVEYSSKDEAAFHSEEWLEIEAESAEQAKDMYEQKFQESEDLANAKRIVAAVNEYDHLEEENASQTVMLEEAENEIDTYKEYCNYISDKIANGDDELLTFQQWADERDSHPPKN